MAKFCLTLLCPPSLEEKVLDLLLDAAGQDVFISMPAAAHGLAHSALKPEEQVLGRSASALLQIIVSDSELEPLLTRLRDELRGTGLRYWASAVALEGEIQ